MEKRGKIKKLLLGVIAAVCGCALIYGVSCFTKDESAEKAEWEETGYSTETDERHEAGDESADNDNNANNNAPSSDETSSSKEERAIIDYEYGACNNGCGCTQYAHYSGNKTCVNCAKHECPTSKYDHERRSQ